MICFSAFAVLTKVFSHILGTYVFYITSCSENFVDFSQKFAMLRRKYLITHTQVKLEEYKTIDIPQIAIHSLLTFSSIRVYFWICLDSFWFA